MFILSAVNTPPITLCVIQPESIRLALHMNALTPIIPAIPVLTWKLLAVYRKIAEKMPDYNIFLFHGSVITVDRQAYLSGRKGHRHFR